MTNVDTQCLRLSPVVGAPILEVTMTGVCSGTCELGDTITYSVTTRNAGNADAANVVVTHDLVNPLTSSTAATLAPGAQLISTGVYNITGADVIATEVQGRATASAENLQGQTITAQSQVVTTPVTQTTPTTVLCQTWPIDVPVADPTPISQTDNVRYFESAAEFVNLVQTNLQPGDILWGRKPTSAPAGDYRMQGIFRMRGSNASPGDTTANGTATNRITVTTDPDVILQGPTLANNPNLWGTLDILGVNYVDVINTRIEGGLFGLRYHSAQGDAANYCRIWNNEIYDTFNAHVAIQGWYTSAHTPHSQYIDLYRNRIHGVDPVSTDPWYTEGIYLGSSSPGWVDRTRDIRIRQNEIWDIGADAVDAKPGVTEVDIEENYFHDFNFQVAPFGDAPNGVISINYAGGASGSAPAGFQTDNNITIARNRVRDWSTFYAVAIGYGGTEVSANIFWGSPGDPVIRTRSEQPFAPTGDTPSPIVLTCNSAPAGTDLHFLYNPSGYPAPTITEDDNIPGQHAATYIGPTTGTADAGEGHGSGFALQAGTGGQGSAGCTDATGCTANVPPDQGALAVAP